jgi:hypothetical protein
MQLGNPSPGLFFVFSICRYNINKKDGESVYVCMLLSNLVYSCYAFLSHFKVRFDFITAFDARVEN